MNRRKDPLEETLDFDNSCDILLLQLFLKLDVVVGLPGVEGEVVDELQRLGLVSTRNGNCYITIDGRKCIYSGGIRKYLQGQPVTATTRFKDLHFNDYPFVVGILLGLISICSLLLFIFSVLY